LPPKRVSEQGRRLVVQVVAGGHDVEAVVQGGPVEHVPLGQAAHRAGRTRPLPAGGGDVVAVVGGQVDLDQLGAVVGGEAPSQLGRAGRVVADAQAQVQAGGQVSQVEQDVPQAQGVLPAGDRDQDPVLRPA